MNNLAGNVEVIEFSVKGKVVSEPRLLSHESEYVEFDFVADDDESPLDGRACHVQCDGYAARRALATYRGERIRLFALWHGSYEGEKLVLFTDQWEKGLRGL